MHGPYGRRLGQAAAAPTAWGARVRCPASGGCSLGVPGAQGWLLCHPPELGVPEFLSSAFNSLRARGVWRPPTALTQNVRVCVCGRGMHLFMMCVVCVQV